MTPEILRARVEASTNDTARNTEKRTFAECQAYAVNCCASNASTLFFRDLTLRTRNIQTNTFPQNFRKAAFCMLMKTNAPEPNLDFFCLLCPQSWWPLCTPRSFSCVSSNCLSARTPCGSGRRKNSCPHPHVASVAVRKAKSCFPRNP